MSFIEVVDRVIELLRHRGRLSYRALKREFDLDEETLEDLKGELLQKAAGGRRQAETEAEECFQKTINIARHQQAKSWELRAATSLARLWQQQGKTTEARDLLAPVYSWFTEGFDTADLKKTKMLLQKLEGQKLGKQAG